MRIRLFFASRPGAHTRRRELLHTHIVKVSRHKNDEGAIDQSLPGRVTADWPKMPEREEADRTANLLFACWWH